MSYDESMDETAGGVGDVSNEVDTFEDYEDKPTSLTITQAERDLNQANREAMAAVNAQQIGDSKLSEDYQAYADALDLDYGKDIDDLGGMSKIFDRGFITNLFAGPKGFDKYAGKALPSTTHGGILESIVESLVYLATMGMIDPELSGYDMIGPDMSGLLSGRPQPQGVQFALPGTAGLLSLALPEITFDAKNQTMGLTGGALAAIDKAAQYAGLAPENENITQDMLAFSTLSPAQTKSSVSTPSVNTQIAGTPSGTPNPNDIFGEDGSVSELSSLSPSQAAATTGVAAAPVDLDQEINVYSGLLGGTPTIEDRDIFGFAAAQGGEVQKFSPGGVAGLMGRRPAFGLGNDIARPNQQQLDLMYQRELAERFGRDTSDPSEGRLGTLGGLYQHPPRVQQPLNPATYYHTLGGMPRPGFPRQQQQPLNPETYYHTHEKGDVDYPNFPKQLRAEKPRRPRKSSITDPIKPQPVVEQKVDPYVQPEFIQQNTTQQIAESVTPATPEAELPVTPVTPVSSPTEAPVVESPAQQINPEEGLSSMMQNKEINISMPSNLTATVEFPEQLTGTVNAKSGGHIQNYSLGGLAQLLGPALAGFAGTPLGLVGSAGLGAAAGYGLAGRKRSFSDAIKGAMLGVAGGGLGQVAGAGPSGIQAGGGFDFLPGNLGGAANQATTLGNTAFQGYTQGLSNAFSGLGSLDMAGLKSAAVPLATGLMGATITTPAEMPNTPLQPAMQAPKAKTEEERKKMAYRGLSPFTAQSFVPPTIYAAAQGGEVPEKETLEEGSFVVPADVVSNIGDGNTSSGFAKLNNMFGKESSDYSLGGPIKGPTGGLDDLRQTTIAGEQAAALSDGEYVVSKGDVMRLGDGSNKKGAEKLYAMMDQVRMSKHGTTKQPENSITLQGLRSMMG